MRRVDLDSVEAGELAEESGGDETVLDLLDLLNGKRVRDYAGEAGISLGATM